MFRKHFRALRATLALAFALLLSPAAHAQQATVADSTTRDDANYTAKIKEYTTEKYFLTELVDHLPASERVPSPDKILGYIVGAPNHLTYSKDIYRYFRELEKASPRVRVFNAPEKSEEGREQMLVAISDEANLQKLDHYKEITARLADPRKTSDAEAAQLISEGKAMYWLSGSIHSPETGSPEMLMELAYRLAVDESPLMQEIRRNTIVLITPVLEVDGHDMMVDVYNYHRANLGKNSPNLLYWGKYVAHDNNRDGLGMALALSRNQMKTFLEYHPQVLHDLHESVPFLYISTGTGPYNAWLDPLVIDEWQDMAYHEIEEMTKRGVPGVWTHGFYDGWAANYMFYVANGHNSIGRFYETFGNGGADTMDRTVGAESQRDWFRPNPPLPRVRWSMRNNINMQESGVLFGLDYFSRNREKFLQNFYVKSKRAVAKATNEGPTAYVIPGDTPRPVEAADMVNLLRLMGVEVRRATREFAVKNQRTVERRGPEGQAGQGGQQEQRTQSPQGGQGSQSNAAAVEQKFPAGSYIVRMDQPYSRMADMILDTQFYNTNDPRPYDDTGWTLGAMRNVKTVRVTDASVLAAPSELLAEDARVKGQLKGYEGHEAVYVINNNTDNTLMTLRYRLNDVKMSVAEAPFKVGGQNFNAGSFVIRSYYGAGQPQDLRERLRTAVEELGLTATGFDKVQVVESKDTFCFRSADSDKAADVKTHEVTAPRVAILHTWQNTQNEGWFRIEFDRLHIPYSYISDHTVRDTPNLREKYDVIIFPPVGGSAQSIVAGIPLRGDPIPWKASNVTPNMADSPDTTDDMRGGMGLAGVANLQRFIQQGGLFVCVQNTTSVPVEFGLTNGVTVDDARQLQARGSLYNATFTDRRSPIAYGYDEQLAVYFNQAPLLRVQTGTPGAGVEGQGGGAGARPSGRGTLEDPDIVQAMPQAGPPPQRPPARPGEEQLTDEQRLQLGPYYVPQQERPRVVMRFARDEKSLLVSGMLAGGSELANRPVVVDVPSGRGHVVLFATNPMWRHQTQGEFFMLFNAVLNFDNLGVGREPEPARPRAGDNEEDQ